MNKDYFHSVTLNTNMCKGCTNCIKYCPTEAIRVRNRKAVIIKERCIDCGVCIRICPYHAKKAVTDSLDTIKNYKYKIALPAPALYGQYGPEFSRERIVLALKQLGFDYVFEVARAAEIVTNLSDKYMKNKDIKKPVISSACPAVVRFIQIRFPNLIENLLKIESPMEIAAALSRQEVHEKFGIPYEDMGVFFISPCAAKVTSVKAPYESQKSNVDAVIAIKDIYLILREIMKKEDKITSAPFSLSSAIGVSWAGTGGESSAINEGRRIAVHGIDNVSDILEQAVQGGLDDIDFIEALACPEGCLGGPLTVENPFIAKENLKNEIEQIAVNAAHSNSVDKADNIDEYVWKSTVEYSPILKLDDDMEKALEKMRKIDEITNGLYDLDCGACGAPSCRALAEDIVRGIAKETDCIFKLKERLNIIANQLHQIE
ncbi:MAG: [Fe-Fe] hydrogenase large subunit C-terminal domain-containing protein [Acetivibrionales bacterium]|jgi:iron only hydrogenase large subunit-like protein|nr:4Fe-4S binding protein [Clostridiaceae bacterium]